ncbi:MAG: beta-glucosidase [Candidatus Eisenbacteria bacterium]|nr:beta-glucosidase [Candidatus Eisenbacteria bacterium]
MNGFPDDFVWGAATSAYQIEGSPLAEGAGPSNWHRFAHTPGTTENGEHGDLACDHYRRWKDDVALMADLGLRAYRFSISWSRVLPSGRGAINQKGLDFYCRLVDELLRRGIHPCATLYHWDLPAALDDQGGWLNRDSAEWFADYARVVWRSLGDRVPMWATLNEPWVVMDAGYMHGVHAPGHRSVHEAARVAHNLLRAHATAVQAYRASCSQKIGLVVNLEPKEPATPRPEDLDACERSHQYMNQQFLDPIFRGSYPDRFPEIYGEAWPEISEADRRLLQTPIDFLGINYYKRGLMADVARSSTGRPEGDRMATMPPYAREVRDPARWHTELGWEVFPDGLTRILCWVKERYGDLPLYVTENGAAFYDPPAPIAGRIDDPMRIEYLRGHLIAARDAIAAGVNLRGYFAWSLFDNYEWAAGYGKRFGLVHVDFATQARTPKASALCYRELIRTNGASLGATLP